MRRRQNSRMAAALVTIMLFLTAAAPKMATPTAHYPKRHRHDKLHQAGWAGAGLTAGHLAGPAGSAAVGAAKYRQDLKAGGRKRTRAIAKISAPIAAGAVAGPPGVVGYEVIDHRNWIKRHILHRKQ